MGGWTWGRREGPPACSLRGGDGRVRKECIIGLGSTCRARGATYLKYTNRSGPRSGVQVAYAPT